MSAPIDPTPQTPGIPAGWYFDSGSGKQRWWDGHGWADPVTPPPSVKPITVGVLSLVFAVISLSFPWMFDTRAFFSITNWLAGGLALAAFILGIVALVTRRGRWWGLAGLILSLVAGLQNIIA